MAVTAAQFKAEFAEFEGAPNALVQAKLDLALRRTPADVWGDQQDDGIKYLAAHLLALSPKGRELKLIVNRDGETTYGNQRREMENIVSCGFRVTGSDT